MTVLGPVFLRLWLHITKLKEGTNQVCNFCLFGSHVDTMFPTERGINVTGPSTTLVGSSSVERKSFSESEAIGASGINILENNITNKGGGEIGVKMGSLRGQDKITNSINEEQLSKAREVCNSYLF